MRYVCREYDAFDNKTFGYIAFADKASAKSYRRKWNHPGNVDVGAYASDVKCPVNVYIDNKNRYFQRLELDASAKALRDVNGKTKAPYEYHETWMHYWC